MSNFARRMDVATPGRLSSSTAEVFAKTVRAVLFCVALTLGVFVVAGVSHAQTLGGIRIPTIPGTQPAKTPQQVGDTVQILIMMTVLTVAPAILIMMTPFTRIVIVLSCLRQAIGAQNIPPNQVMLGLAMFLTFFVMQPTLVKVNDDAIQPYMAKKIDFNTAVDRGEIPLRRFMVAQTYKDDLRLFLQMSRTPPPKVTDPLHPADNLPMQVVIPSFVISELKTGFIFGFIIYVPFIVIDLVISALLMSMGMMMLPPTVISLPAKILVFILADGWHAIIGSLAASYR